MWVLPKSSLISIQPQKSAQLYISWGMRVVADTFMCLWGQGKSSRVGKADTKLPYEAMLT